MGPSSQRDPSMFLGNRTSSSTLAVLTGVPQGICSSNTFVSNLH